MKNAKFSHHSRQNMVKIAVQQRLTLMCCYYLNGNVLSRALVTPSYHLLLCNHCAPYQYIEPNGGNGTNKS